VFDVETAEALSYVYETHNLDTPFRLAGLKAEGDLVGTVYHASHVLGAVGVLLDGDEAGPDRPRPAARRRTASRPAAPATKFCHACAERLDARAELCPHCGVRQPALRGRAPHADRTRTMAAVLALVSLFLGGIGLHKFYLGQRAAGVLCILFFWTGIPWLVSLVNLASLLTMTDERFEEKYG
jgi:TM2 domain-containing membrane protein YozV